MAATQVSLDTVQLTFIHSIDNKYLEQPSKDTTLQHVNLKQFLSECSSDMFKSFLINGKREIALIGVKARVISSYLNSVGIKELHDTTGNHGHFWSSYLKWNTYFFESQDARNNTVQIETGTIQGGTIAPSYYFDENKDIFFCLLPINVEVSTETTPSNDSKPIKVGIKLYYNLDLVREKVFMYHETNSLASYLIQVQTKSKPKTAEHLVYIDREVTIKQCLSIHSSFTRSSNDIYLRVFIRNEMKSYPYEDFPEGSIFRRYISAQDSEERHNKVDLHELYTGKVHNFQLKFESSLNQGIFY